jgi:two-component system, OmpR family, sensor kinase
VSRNRRQLNAMRWRLTVMYTVLSALGLAALAAVTIVLDGNSRDRRADLERLALANRGVSLVDDDVVPADVQPLVDDALNDQAQWQAYERAPDGTLTLLSPGFAINGSLALAERALNDESDRGSFGAVRVSDDVPARAAALPFYRGDEIAGALVVATPVVADPDHRRLVRWVVASVALLVAAAALIGWWFAGRSVRPAIDALDRQEQFLSAAAHELRTPVSRVRAVTDVAALIGNELTVQSMRAESLDELRTELARLRQLSDETSSVVESLLTIARVDADRVVVDKQPVNLGDMLGRLARSHPIVALAGDLTCTVSGDERLLSLAFGNLVSNAERHAAGVSDLRVTIDIGRRGSTVVVRVADNGPGVPAGLLPTVFERLQSGQRHGSGVGLWLVRWIVEAHGGRITADNAGGAIFTVTLPA